MSVDFLDDDRFLTSAARCCEESIRLLVELQANKRTASIIDANVRDISVGNRSPLFRQATWAVPASYRTRETPLVVGSDSGQYPPEKIKPQREDVVRIYNVNKAG
jgi:hypothetical protein